MADHFSGSRIILLGSNLGLLSLFLAANICLDPACLPCFLLTSFLCIFHGFWANCSPRFPVPPPVCDDIPSNPEHCGDSAQE